MNWPRLTIVTTNYNYDRFVGAAIESVLAQEYPNLEYFVYDAASTDGSVEIIRGFSKHLSGWHSARDSGPSAALNIGLRRASGEWYYYLNSDDVLLPGALRLFAEVARASGPRLWISGGRHDIDASGQLLARRMPWKDDAYLFALGRMWHVAEGTFLHVPSLRKHALEFDESYKNIFDTVLYTKLDRREPPLYADAFFGAMRLHGTNKSGPTNQFAVTEEAARHALECGPSSALVRASNRIFSTRFASTQKRFLAGCYRARLLGSVPVRHAAIPTTGQRFVIKPLRQVLTGSVLI